MAERNPPRSRSYCDRYVEVVLQAERAGYSPVKGTVVIRPRGCALWERMQQVLDSMFKATRGT